MKIRLSKNIQPIIIFIQLSVFAFLAILFLRSGIFLWRIIQEVQQPIDQPSVYAGNPCKSIHDFSSREEFYRYQYERQESECE